MNGWMDEWMDGWMSELLLCWATSSLSDLFAEVPGYLLSQLLLLWAASYQGTSSLTLLWAASQLPLFHLLHPNFSLRAAVTICFCFSNLQLQSRKAGAPQHHRCFLARRRANAFVTTGRHNRLSHPVANPHSRSVSTKSTNRSHSKWQKGWVNAAPSMPVFCDICLWWNRASSGYSLVHILSTFTILQWTYGSIQNLQTEPAPNQHITGCWELSSGNKIVTPSFFPGLTSP